MDLNKKYGYVPYNGGAGPTESEVEAFVDLLLHAAREEGLDARIGECDEGLKWVIVGPVGEREVTYDRWGYCDGANELDQGDLNDAIAYLRGE